jgi:hypothetical protein
VKTPRAQRQVAGHGGGQAGDHQHTELDVARATRAHNSVGKGAIDPTEVADGGLDAADLSDARA